ncbi:hypothetical protein G6F65_016253 [Rhizopus arrhizus]|nr:hypothetical protein G6F65_016253 [Rhizopus arrhizus]
MRRSTSAFADGGTGGQHQPQRCTLRRVAARGQLSLQVGGIDQQRARRLQQRAAVPVQGQATADAVEQRGAEMCLQLLQGGAAGRLRERDGLARSGGAAVVSDGDEDLQLAQGARWRHHFRPAPVMNAPALSPWSLPALRQRWQPRLPGLLLVGLIAAASLYLAELPWLQAHGLSALTVAIVAGIVVGNTLYPRLAPSSAAGVGFSKHWLLRAGIVLYGLRLTFQDIGHVGVAGVLMDVLVVASTFGLACWLGVRLGYLAMYLAGWGALRSLVWAISVGFVIASLFSGV